MIHLLVRVEDERKGGNLTNDQYVFPFVSRPVITVATSRQLLATNVRDI